jgi:hypothetical protein
VSSLSDKLIRSFKVTAQDNQRPKNKIPERTPSGRLIRTRIDKLPEIVSKTPSLEVVKAEVKPLYNAGDFLVLTVRNNSPKAVFSFTVCTTQHEFGGTSISYAAGEDVGVEYILPYDEKTVEIIADNFEPDKPITLCAVTFSDDSQEGLPEACKSEKKSWQEVKKQRGFPR